MMCFFLGLVSGDYCGAITNITIVGCWLLAGGGGSSKKSKIVIFYIFITVKISRVSIRADLAKTLAKTYIKLEKSTFKIQK